MLKIVEKHDLICKIYFDQTKHTAKLRLYKKISENGLFTLPFGGYFDVKKQKLNRLHSITVA